MASYRDKTAWIWRNVVDREQPLASIHVEDNPDSNVDVTWNSEIVASFNWCVTRSKRYYMSVPGVPLRYKPWSGGQLSHSETVTHANVDWKINRQYMMESFLRACKLSAQLTQRNVQFQQYNFCTWRNNLRKLYSLISCTRTKRDGPFRIDVERVGNLIILCIVEAKYEMVVASDNYGFLFESVNTEPINKARPTSIDHCFQAIQQVSFGSLKMLVGYEVDCADYSSVDGDVQEKLSQNLPRFETPVHFDETSRLSYALNAELCLPNGENGCLDIPVKRIPVLMELATFRRNLGNKLNSKWSQMFFSGTSKLVLGRHENGNFIENEEMPFEKVEEKIGGRPENNLRKMAGLLKNIQNVCLEQPEGTALSLIWHPQICAENELRVYTRRCDSGPVPANFKHELYK